MESHKWHSAQLNELEYVYTIYKIHVCVKIHLKYALEFCER